MIFFLRGCFFGKLFFTSFRNFSPVFVFTITENGGLRFRIFFRFHIYFEEFNGATLRNFQNMFDNFFINVYIWIYILSPPIQSSPPLEFIWFCSNSIFSELLKRCFPIFLISHYCNWLVSPLPNCLLCLKMNHTLNTPYTIHFFFFKTNDVLSVSQYI